MKTTLLKRQTAFCTASFLVAALAAPCAFANTGTVTINGTVSATTCTTSVNGGASSATVALPNISSSMLGSVGATAGATRFTIAVSGCTGATGTTKIDAFFTQANFDTAITSLLASNTGTASGVRVQLLTSDCLTVIDGTKTYGYQYTGQGATSAVLYTAPLSYCARYYRTGATFVGTVSSSFGYTISYH